MEATNFVGLMEMLGIENESIRSGPLKARPNPLERMTPEGRAASQQIIDEIHEMFVGMVAERRGLDFATAARLADGRIYTGATAAANGLIDELGGEREARRWLEETHGISAELPLYDVEIQYPIDFFDAFVSVVFGKSYLPERLTLDGLVSVWHPLLSVSD
jgi:protease-4